MRRSLHELCGNAGTFGCRDILPELKSALAVAEEVDTDERTFSGPEAEIVLARLNAVELPIRPPTVLPRAAS